MVRFNPELTGGPWSAVHRTSRQAAERIRRFGFSTALLGTGAGLGYLEEPGGVFVSRHPGKDFAAEVEERGLPLTEVLKVRIKKGTIWQPTEIERIAKSRELMRKFVRRRYGVDAVGAEAIITGRAAMLRHLGLIGDWKDWTHSLKTEAAWKLYYAQQLRKEGYVAVEWTEPLFGVDQTVVLDPRALTVLNNPAGG